MSTAMNNDRSSQSVSFGHPHCFCSVVETSRGHSVMSEPLTHGVCDTVYGDVSVGSSVVILFGVCRPTAVRRLVVPIHIDAINGVFRARFTSHVFKECFVAPPPFANSDTSPSVVRPHLGVRVGASMNHLSPRIVFWSSKVFHRTSMRRVPVLSGRSSSNHTHINTQASATLGVPSANRRTNDLDAVPASALAKPYTFIVRGSHIAKLNHSQSSKRLVCNVSYRHVMNMDSHCSMSSGSVFNV